MPHMAREEEKVFPAILKLKPNEEPLISKLLDEHKSLLDYYGRLRECLASGKIVENLDPIKENLSLRDHINKEEPLYQLLLKEALEK